MGCLKITYRQEPELRIVSSEKRLTLKSSAENLRSYRPFGMQMPGRNGSTGEYRYGFNGMEKDDEVKGSGNSLDFGARVYDSRVGRFLSMDPKSAVYPSYSPYSFAGNSPTNYYDKKGEEPDRRHAGTIQEALGQWRKEPALKNANANDLANYIRNNGNKAIRYVYTEKRGWIDLVHYLKASKNPLFDLAEEIGKFDSDRSGVLKKGAKASTYSYEDLPSNKMGYESQLYEAKISYEEDGDVGMEGGVAKYEMVDYEGEDLFQAIEKEFEAAGAKEPEAAPNWEQMPFDHGDRGRLPGGTKAEQEHLLRTGKYVPQNKSYKPLNLNNFAPAPTSVERGDTRTGVAGH